MRIARRADSRQPRGCHHKRAKKKIPHTMEEIIDAARWDIRAASASPISRKERQTTKDERRDNREPRITISSNEVQTIDSHSHREIGNSMKCVRTNNCTRYSVIRDDHLVITRFVFRPFVPCVNQTQLVRFNASLTLNASLQGTVFHESKNKLAERVNYRETRNVATTVTNYNSI